MFPGIGVLLADGDHSPVDADKFFSAEIIHIFKVDDIGAVDPVKGFRRELLLQVRDISIKFNGRPGLHMDLDDPVLYLEKNNVRQETEPMVFPNLYVNFSFRPFSARETAFKKTFSIFSVRMSCFNR